jgi:hypothetical protein
MGKGKRKGYLYMATCPALVAYGSDIGKLGFQLDYEIGYAHFIARNIAVTFSFGYTWSMVQVNEGASITGSIFGGKIGLSAFLY